MCTPKTVGDSGHDGHVKVVGGFPCPYKRGLTPGGSAAVRYIAGVTFVGANQQSLVAFYPGESLALASTNKEYIPSALRVQLWTGEQGQLQLAIIPVEDGDPTRVRFGVVLLVCMHTSQRWAMAVPPSILRRTCGTVHTVCVGDTYGRGADGNTMFRASVLSTTARMLLPSLARHHARRRGHHERPAIGPYEYARGVTIGTVRPMLRLPNETPVHSTLDDAIRAAGFSGDHISEALLEGAGALEHLGKVGRVFGEPSVRMTRNIPCPPRTFDEVCKTLGKHDATAHGEAGTSEGEWCTSRRETEGVLGVSVICRTRGAPRPVRFVLV